jgi:hypothetical protein
MGSVSSSPAQFAGATQVSPDLARNDSATAGPSLKGSETGPEPPRDISDSECAPHLSAASQALHGLRCLPCDMPDRSQSPASCRYVKVLIEYMQNLPEKDPISALLRHHRQLIDELDLKTETCKDLEEELKKEQVTRMEVTAGLEDLVACLRTQNSDLRAQMNQHRCEGSLLTAPASHDMVYRLETACCADFNEDPRDYSRHRTTLCIVNSGHKRKCVVDADGLDGPQTKKRRRYSNATASCLNAGSH